MEGPFGFNPFEVLSLLPSLKSINGISTADMPSALSDNAAYATATSPAPAPVPATANGARSAAGTAAGGNGLCCCLFPRRDKCQGGEPIAERVMRAMWRYAMVYRLASESQLDDTPVW